MNRQVEFLRFALAASVLISALGASAAGSLADAKAKIAPAIANPSLMTKTVKELGPAEQRAYVPAVNKAIEKMPGSEVLKTGKFVVCNEAMLKGSAKNNIASMIAAVYASVPLPALPAVNKCLANNLFNQETSKCTDAQFRKIAESVLDKVRKQADRVDNGAQRTALAILMFAEASSRPAEEVSKELAPALPKDKREKAEKEWFGPALKGNFEPIVGNADIVEMLPTDLDVRSRGAVILDEMLPEVVNVVEVLPVLMNEHSHEQPMIGAQNETPVTPTTDPVVDPEPGPYANQTTKLSK